MSKRFTTVISVPADTAEALIDLLNIELANNTLGQLIIKFAHWNVKGSDFFPAHKLFDQVYDVVQEGTDTIAERITALGGVALGLPAQSINLSTLKEYAADDTDDVETHTAALVQVLGELANGLRAVASSEPGKTDLVSQTRILDIVNGYDQQLYFLEASLR